MSCEQWMINDALGVLLQLSRWCGLAPIRFVQIRSDTFIYITRPLMFFSIIITSIVELYTICYLYLTVSSINRGYYNEAFFIVIIMSAIIVFVSYAALYSERRIKNYMTCFTKLKKAIRVLYNAEEMNVKRWHIWIIFVILAGGINLGVVFYQIIYDGYIRPLIYILMLKNIMSVIVQQQFLYFVLYVNFVLKNIEERLQNELTKIINDKDGKQIGNFSTNTFNIPLESINKAIDMIGMTDALFPELLTTEKQNIAQSIRRINDCYVLACEVLLELSSTDGFLIFLLLIYYSCGTVYCLYSIIRLLNQDGLLLNIKLIANCLQLLMFTTRIIIIVEPCHKTHEMILKIRFLVSKIMCYGTSTSDPVFRVIDGFYHQLVLNDISYTALEICKIGRPLVTSIMAVVTTILIAIFDL